MGLFSTFAGANINDGSKEIYGDRGCVSPGVRTEDEYRSGHIPGSINLPVQNIGKIKKVIPDKTSDIFVYCLSGARSSQAVEALKREGYEKVTNIGGISRYKGELKDDKLLMSQYIKRLILIRRDLAAGVCRKIPS